MGTTGFLAPDFWLPSTVAPCLEVESLGVSPVDGNQKSGEVPPVEDFFTRVLYTQPVVGLGIFFPEVMPFNIIQLFTAIFPTRKTKSHENKTWSEPFLVKKARVSASQ